MYRDVLLVGGGLPLPQKGYWDVLEHLLEFGAAPNQRDASRSTPLMWAAQAGGREAVNVLLERGADPNLVNERRETALLMAATTTKAQHYMRRPSPLMQHADCVQALLAAGAKADRKGALRRACWVLSVQKHSARACPRVVKLWSL